MSSNQATSSLFFSCWICRWGVNYVFESPDSDKSPNARWHSAESPNCQALPGSSRALKIRLFCALQAHLCLQVSKELRATTSNCLAQKVFSCPGQLMWNAEVVEGIRALPIFGSPVLWKYSPEFPSKSKYLQLSKKLAKPALFRAQPEKRQW